MKRLSEEDLEQQALREKLEEARRRAGMDINGNPLAAGSLAPPRVRRGSSSPRTPSASELEWRLSPAPRSADGVTATFVAPPPAIVHPLAEDLAACVSSSKSRTLSSTGRSLFFFNREIAIMDASIAIQTKPTYRLSMLGSVASIRFLWWMIRSVHEQFHRAPHDDPRVLNVDGGFTGLTRILRLSSKYHTRVAQLVEEFAHWEFTLANGGRGTLISKFHLPSTRSRRSVLQITVGPQLAPRYVQGLSGAAARRLVPILRADPPVVGSPLLHGAQYAMMMGLVVDMRERARELAEFGGVNLDWGRWTDLADKAGVPRKDSMVVDVRNAWLTGMKGVPPLLECIGADRYRLSAAHAAERDYMEDAGQDSLVGVAVARDRERAKRARGKFGRTPGERT